MPGHRRPAAGHGLYCLPVTARRHGQIDNHDGDGDCQHRVGEGHQTFRLHGEHLRGNCMTEKRISRVVATSVRQEKRTRTFFQQLAGGAAE